MQYGGFSGTQLGAVTESKAKHNQRDGDGVTLAFHFLLIFFSFLGFFTTFISSFHNRNTTLHVEMNRKCVAQVGRPTHQGQEEGNT